MSEFLLEIFCEEIPARMQVEAANNLKSMLTKSFSEKAIGYDSAETYVTPRRITFVATGLPLKQADIKEEKRGPRADAPEVAIEGFLKSSNLKKEDLEVRSTPKGDFFFANIEKKGLETIEILPEIVTTMLSSFYWQKSMRWGEGKSRWVRPLHNLLCLLNGKVVELEFAGIKSNNRTSGHRFMAPGWFEVNNFDDYKTKLYNSYVMLDREEKKKKIVDEAKKFAILKGLVLDEKVALIEEVCGLVEWPVVLMGSIDEKFMSVPSEVLVSSMGKHQKYFSLRKTDGSLAPYFVVVSNMVTSDGGKAIVAGNERVLRARLSDAAFFWEQDRKSKLESRISKLEERVFHAKLGTDYERTLRIKDLASRISIHIHDADIENVERAALLAKADLTSGMVGEFPELQGIMGEHYANFDGENPSVAKAIAEHYSPQGPNDNCPKAPLSIAVSLADKIDMLTGFWLIDLKPTGSKDPFALRRAALGVIRLILENEIRIPLSIIFNFAEGLYVGQSCGDVPKIIEEKGKSWLPEQTKDLLLFFADRLKVYLKEQGINHDLIAAVFANSQKTEDDLVRLLAKVNALKAFLGSDDGANLLIAYRRAANIVRIEEKKDNVLFNEQPDSSHFKSEEEHELFKSLMKIVDGSKEKLDKEQFKEAMELLSELRKPVDNFFDKVTVNCDDKNLRANRLKLLSCIVRVMGFVADFSKIEG